MNRGAFIIVTMIVCLVVAGGGLAHAAPAVRLDCNKTLAPGSTLMLTDKRDLSGKMPCADNCTNDPYPCAIVGPDPAGPAATVHVPPNDCVLIAQGEVTISGRVRFVVGHKNRAFDCCRDGEGHGSVLCSYSNLTIARGAVVTLETTDDDVVVNPGGFWTGEWITVHGTVNASLKMHAGGKGQMTGVNGLLSSSGIRVGATGAVIASGQNVARGAAVQGGGHGTVVDGSVTCSAYNVSDAGGCLAAGNNFTLGPAGRIAASDAFSVGGAGGVLDCGSNVAVLQGRVVADRIRSPNDAGAVLTGNGVVMLGDARIVGTDIYAGGGPAVVTATNFTMRGNARLEARNTWGGDGGAVEVTRARFHNNSSVFCENAYADSFGACVAGDIALDGTASIVARNMTGKALGGALGGGYPRQNLSVTGAATVLVEGSTAGMYGGAIIANTITIGGTAKVTLRDTSAACGGAINTLDDGMQIGQGKLVIDGTGGAALLIEDARELNATLGCRSVMAHMAEAQPCSGCAAKPSEACACANAKAGAAFTECCNSS